MTKNMNNSPTTTFKHPHLQSFLKRYPTHQKLLLHAAFPLALTPELLYCLRENFVPDSPWIAVSDILLFLCHPVGFQLYEMSPDVRNELLHYLQPEELHKLSDFMVEYIRQQLKTNYRADEDLGAAPQWTALAYIKPEDAIQEIKDKIQALLKNQDSRKLIKFASVLESYAEIDPLIKAGLQPLLMLASGEYLTFDFEVVTVNRRGEIIKREPKQATYFVEDLGNGVTLDMVAIPGGKFMMGSPEGEGRDEEKPQHEVTVPPFFMGKYQVTQAQWRVVAALPKIKDDLKSNPSEFKGDNLPVEGVFWDDAVEFCARISKATGKEYRLPSEAEWEYACRAGTTTPFHFGETITSELANYDANYTFADEPKGTYREKTTAVGSFPPNAFGLYDMHGNVWEWCADDWHGNYINAPTNGTAWISRSGTKSSRGGSWFNYTWFCRCASRYNFDLIDDNSGFRVVRVPPRT
ncbi:formylglycine-generating enzyme family protein [Anabaena sp. UHCC 0451]|uniref:formylglycine-generating enzyme family protein n=1 Tax=Anabaena sp. UHCC 0451 TaxID=2055235 RepID=UPI002B21F9DE|nr:formylglycine-generating enzyme family protein [Anabaena sp. UHCC 0451]MEA5577621.1 formylglycine-generating enzyme family protein [Anabaena sp. UHCC 0451]